MIIPVKCFTCGCVLADKYRYFQERVRKIKLRDGMQIDKITYLTKKVTQPIILVSQANKMCNEEWDYSKRGSDWECTCKEGKERESY